MFTSNTDVSVINQMKNKEGNGPYQRRRRSFSAIGHGHGVGSWNWRILVEKISHQSVYLGLG
jgi:hypothetical protein